MLHLTIELPDIEEPIKLNMTQAQELYNQLKIIFDKPCWYYDLYKWQPLTFSDSVKINVKTSDSSNSKVFREARY